MAVMEDFVFELFVSLLKRNLNAKNFFTGGESLSLNTEATNNSPCISWTISTMFLLVLCFKMYSNCHRPHTSTKSNPILLRWSL